MHSLLCGFEGAQERHRGELALQTRGTGAVAYTCSNKVELVRTSAT